MLIYISAHTGGEAPAELGIIGFNHSMAKALAECKKHADDNDVKCVVYRVVLRCNNKRDVCEILAGKAKFNHWQTLFTCIPTEDGVSVKRHRLE